MTRASHLIRGGLSEPLEPWTLYGLGVAGAIVGAFAWTGESVGPGILALAGLAFLTVILRRHPIDTIGVAVGRLPALLRLVILLPLMILSGLVVSWSWPLVVWLWCAYQIRRGWIGPPEVA